MIRRHGIIKRNRHHVWTGIFYLTAAWAIVSLIEPTDGQIRQAAMNDAPDARILAAREATPEPRKLPPLVKAAAPQRQTRAAAALMENMPEPLEPLRVETADIASALKPAEDAAPGNKADETGKADETWVEVSGASMVNVRAGPGVSNRDIATFSRGTRLRVLGKQGNWTQVENPDTRVTGWMNSNYLEDAPARKSVAKTRDPSSG